MHTGEVVNEPVGQALVTTAVYVFLRTRGSRGLLERCLIKVRYYRPIAQSSSMLKLYESGFGVRGTIIRKWLITLERRRARTLRSGATLKLSAASSKNGRYYFAFCVANPLAKSNKYINYTFLRSLF